MQKRRQYKEDPRTMLDHKKKMGLSQTLAFEPKTLGISRPLLRLQTCMNSPQLVAASWGVFAIDPNTDRRERANIPNQASPPSFFANSKISGIFSRILL